jgi:hypothetical protein
MHCLLNFEMFKIYTRIQKYRSYMFRSSTIIRDDDGRRPKHVGAIFVINSAFVGE